MSTFFESTPPIAFDRFAAATSVEFGRSSTFGNLVFSERGCNKCVVAYRNENGNVVFDVTSSNHPPDALQEIADEFRVTIQSEYGDREYTPRRIPLHKPLLMERSAMTKEEKALRREIEAEEDRIEDEYKKLEAAHNALSAQDAPSASQLREVDAKMEELTKPLHNMRLKLAEIVKSRTKE